MIGDLYLFRTYAPEECGSDGYPFGWHDLGDGRGIKDLVREHAGHRCQRCGHPYEKGMGEWSPCDERCTHGGPVHVHNPDQLASAPYWSGELYYPGGTIADVVEAGMPIEAHWRILTVHHLTGVKADLRWWNLAALCQRCHLFVQRKVVMDRPWPWPHSEWFELHAGGWYALKYQGLDLTREQTAARLEELLQVGRMEEAIERMAL